MGKKRLSQLPEVQIGLPPPRSYTGHPSGGVTVGMALGQKEVRILAPTAAPSTVKSESWLYFRQSDNESPRVPCVEYLKIYTQRDPLHALSTEGIPATTEGLC